MQCRIRKSKCTGEASGCQRCSAKNIQCHYTAPNNFKLRKRGAEGRLEASPEISTSELGSRKTRSEITEVSSTPSNSGTTVGVSQGSNTISQSSNMIDTAVWSQRHNSSSESEYVFDFGSHGVAEGVLDDFTPGMPSLDLLGNDSSLDFETESRNTTAEDSQTGTQDPEVSMTSADGSACSCFSRAIVTHEAIEVNLVYALQGSAGTAESFLRQLKTSIADCEALLLCDSCRYRSDYIMLILSMCEKLASSLENAWLVMPSGGRAVKFDHSTGQGVSSPVGSARSRIRRDSTAFQQPQSRADPRPAVAEGGSGKGEQVGPGGDIEKRSAPRRLEIGLWKLDDDDEIHVFYGLLLARVGMFDALLTTLEMLVTSQYWPVHKSVIMELQERCVDMFTMVRAAFKGNGLNLL